MPITTCRDEWVSINGDLPKFPTCPLSVKRNRQGDVLSFSLEGGLRLYVVCSIFQVKFVLKMVVIVCSTLVIVCSTGRLNFVLQKNV